MSDAQIHLTGYVDVPPARWQEVLAALPAHIAATRAEPGCLSFEVAPDPQQPHRLRVAERFVDRAAFEAHQQRMQASPWAQVTRGLTRNYRIS